jgi:hypothetical protein
VFRLFRRRPEEDPERRHQELLREQRASRRWLAVTAVATLLAAVGGLLGVWLGGDDERPESGKANVAPVRIAVRNTENFEKPQQVEVTLHNRGTRRAVLTNATLRVRDAVRLPLCFTQGYLAISQSYQARVPRDVKRGDSIDVPINQQLGADEADRFAFSLGVPEEAEERRKPGATPHIYVLGMDILVREGAGAAPTKIGSVVIALPNVPSETEFYWGRFLAEKTVDELTELFGTPGFETDQVFACWRDNSVNLKRVLARPGNRSRELAATGASVEIPRSVPPASP